MRDDIAIYTDPVLQYADGVIEALGLLVKSENLLLSNLYRQPDDPAGGHQFTSEQFQHALN